MRNETIAIHAGYDPDPTTKSVAVPIYQTVAYAFDSADHGAALFNLEAEGYRYSRIANPTTAVLWSTSPIPAATSSRFRNCTAPPTPCSRMCCRARASPPGLPTATRPTRSRS
jgi:hypothetical protein